MDVTLSYLLTFDLVSKTIIILIPHFHYAATLTFFQKFVWLAVNREGFFHSRNVSKSGYFINAYKTYLSHHFNWTTYAPRIPPMLQESHLCEKEEDHLCSVGKHHWCLSSVLGNPVTIWQHLKMTVRGVIGQCRNRITANVKERTRVGIVI